MEARSADAIGTMITKHKGIQPGFIDRTFYTLRNMRPLLVEQVGDTKIHTGIDVPDDRYLYPSDHIGTYAEFIALTRETVEDGELRPGGYPPG